MRSCLLFLFSFLTTAPAWSQPDISSNSFETTYKKANPAIIYTYDSLKQIHDYSNNWDFDKDGKADQLYFVGTGGAHLYYFLRVILSNDGLVRDFPFLQSDFPILPPNDELSKPDFSPKKSTAQFAVLENNKDKSTGIFIKLDNSSFKAEKKALNKKGIKTDLVIINFKKGKTFFKDFYN